MQYDDTKISTTRTIGRIQDIASDATDYSLNITKKTLYDIQEEFRKSSEFNKTILEESAISDFAITLETAKQLARLNPQNYDKIINNAANEAYAKIKEVYGDLSPDFLSKSLRIKSHAKLSFLQSGINKNVKEFGFDTAKEAFSMVALNANSMSQEDLNNSLSNLTNAVSNSIGENASYLLSENAKALSEIRRKLTNPNDTEEFDFKSEGTFAYSDKDLRMTTETGTDLLKLMMRNPMLARGFLRIRNKTNEESEQLSRTIRTAYPDSPEPAAIDMALYLRDIALRSNALEFGMNQLMYEVPSSTTDLFKFESNGRFLASLKAYQKFGITNFFTQSERTMFKNTSTLARVVAFNMARNKLTAFNSTMPLDKKIDPVFMEKEFELIDSDAATWSSLISNMPQYADLDLDYVKEVVKSLKDSKAWIPPTIREEFYGVQGIGKIADQLSAANYITKGEQLTNLSDIFKFRNSYAYHKDYIHGDMFEEYAGKALGDKYDGKIILRNIGLNLYRVYTKGGNPILDPRGKIVEIDADFLEKIISSEIARQRSEDEEAAKLLQEKTIETGTFPFQVQFNR